MNKSKAPDESGNRIGQNVANFSFIKEREIFLGLEEKLSLNDIKILHLMILGYFLLVNF